jgi:dynein heavy chain
MAFAGIFERHKLMFSFQMTCMIMNGEGALDAALLDFFLKGDTSLEAVGEACPCAWLALSGWKDLLCLASLAPVCAELVAEFKANSAVWKEW